MPIKKMANQEVNFGDLGFYVHGGGLPEGNYALEFQVQMYQAKKQSGETAGPSRLGVMMTAYSLTNPAAEPRTQFYSMGSKAHESFAPNPDTGKGLVPVAGGSGASTLNMSTNWAFFLKSMYDCGLPQGVFTNDLTVLDGVHAHVHNVPEPEERKGFVQSKTSEVESEPRKNQTIAIVSEILENGSPWEGGGGIPEKEVTAAAPKPAANMKAPAKTAPKIAPKVAPKAPPAPPSGEMSEEELMDAAVQGVTSVLEKNPDGCGKLVLRTGTFKAIQASAGDDAAQAVLDTFFGSDEALNSVLSQLGYTVSGAKIVAG